MRVYYYKPYNELVLISSGDVNSFHIIIINFIIDLLSARDSYINKIYNTILILVDKLIKHVIYIAITKNLKVNELANIMWREFILLRDIMRNLILDRGLLFINKF